jgi:MFS family permease
MWRLLLRVPRSVLAAVLAVRMVDESSTFIVPGTFESLRADVGLTYAQASSAFVAIAVGALAGTAATVAADRHSRRLICTAGAGGYAVALALIGAADSYSLFLAGAFVLGVASTALVDTAEIALADLAPDEDDLERRLTTQNVLGSVGDLLGPAVVVGVAAIGISWRWSFVVAAVLVALYGAWLATLPFPPPHPSASEETIRGTLRSVAGDPLVWLAGAASMLLGPLDEPLLAFLIAHLEDARGLTSAGATAIATLSVVGGFVGYATLRVRKGVLPVDAALLAVSATAVVLAPEAITAAIASGLIGVFVIRVWIDLQARTLLLRPGQAGAVKALVNVVETVGWALPLLAGAIADHLDVTAGLASYAVMAWALALAAFGLSSRATKAGRGRRRESPGAPSSAAAPTSASSPAPSAASSATSSARPDR